MEGWPSMGGEGQRGRRGRPTEHTFGKFPGHDGVARGSQKQYRNPARDVLRGEEHQVNMESSQNAGGFGSTPHSRAQPTVVPSDHGGERQKNTARPQISVQKKRVQGKDEKMGGEVPGVRSVRWFSR